MSGVKRPTYFMFIDESGVSSLNRKSDLFLLSSVIINKEDFEIVEGYIRLLKRRFLTDDYTNLHANELFETPDTSYPMLKGKKLNGFLVALQHVLSETPYNVRVYSVDKTKLCTDLGYTPVPKKKSTTINLDMPYEIAATNAIRDFTRFLVERDASGEIIIESRLFSDAQFVSYFDSTRQHLKKGSVEDDLATEVKDRVTSLVIANKKQLNGGLEIADLCGYVEYRRLTGDPDSRLKVPMTALTAIHGVIKKHTYSIESGVKSMVIKCEIAHQD